MFDELKERLNLRKNVVLQNACLCAIIKTLTDNDVVKDEELNAHYEKFLSDDYKAVIDSIDAQLSEIAKYENEPNPLSKMFYDAVMQAREEPAN